MRGATGATLQPHQILCLPRKVTFELHQILPLPQKMTLELHQIMRLPRKMTLELHQILPLPRKVTMTWLFCYLTLLLLGSSITWLYYYLTLPWPNSKRYHALRRLPQKVHLRISPNGIADICTREDSETIGITMDIFLFLSSLEARHVIFLCEGHHFVFWGWSSCRQSRI